MIEKISDSNKFSQNDAKIAKGIAVCFLLLHHLFGDISSFQKFSINSMFLSQEIILTIGMFSKICLAIFVFISGYGITYSMNRKQECIQKNTLRRFLSLFLNYTYIFIVFNLLSILLPVGIHNTISIYFSNGIMYGILYILCDWLCLSNFIGLPTMNVTWWWMPIALLIIYLVPMLSNNVKKYGVFTYMAVIFIPFAIGLNNGTSLYLLPSLVLGMLFAEYSIFERIFTFISENKWRKYLSMLATIILFIFLFGFRIRIIALNQIIDSILAALVCGICSYVLSKISLISHVLSIIGHYSLEIFLIHTFVFMYWFSSCVYYFSNWMMILLVLLITCLTLSVILNFIKRVLKIEVLIDKIIKKVMVLNVQ